MINQNTENGRVNINFVTPGTGGVGAVKSVNGKTGVVVLTPEDVHALPEDTYIPSTDGLASTEYVDEAVKNVKVDLSGYATKKYVEVAIQDVEVDLTGYATEAYVNKAVDGLEGPQGPKGDTGSSGVHIGPEAPTDPEMVVWIDTDGEPSGELATRGYVDEAIAAIDFPETDLTGYATEKYVGDQIAAIPAVDLSGYATQKYVQLEIANIPDPDLSDYALKSEIPSTTGLATEKYVDESIAAIEIPDNTPIATVEVAGKVKPDGTTILISEDGTISSIATGGSGEGIEEVYVGTEDPGTSSDALIWINPEGSESAGLVTKEYVDEAIEGISSINPNDYYTQAEIDLMMPITTGFITMSDVEEKGYQTETQVNSLINTALAAINVAEEGEY